MISATIEELYSGAWVADTVDVVAPTGYFTTSNGQAWSGTVFSQSKDGGRYYARIVGGKGNLAKALPDRFYNGTSLIDQIATDALAEAGEVGTSDLGTRVDAWHRKAATLGQALSHIVAIVGGVWYVDRAGNVRLATQRTGPVVQPNTVSAGKADVDGSILFDPFPTADIQLGGTWDGRTIRHIRWVQTPNSFKASVSFQDLQSPPLTWDYLRTYSAKVDKQNSDGTLDLIVDSKFSVTSVRWLGGLPGKIVIQGGDEVTLGWLGGDPRAAYAVGLGMTDGGKAVARVDDTVDCGYLVTPVQGNGVGTVVIPPTLYFPPGPEGEAAAKTAAVAPAYNPAGIINIRGVITSGQVRVLI